MKYVLVSGGVMSGLGKGISSSSVGLLLQSCGMNVTSIKIDPYLNADAGTMSPFEHGEVYVLDDGGEADLDLGNYERFLGITLTRDHNITTGKVYRQVMENERKGLYLGKTVQVIPHITDHVQAWIKSVAKIPVDGKGTTPDVCIIELGGTVGDIESSVFLEALRQFETSVGPDNFCHITVSLTPSVGGEQKSKPTQHAVRELRALGLIPNLIFCRSDEELDTSVRGKISSFCGVPLANVISVHNVKNIMYVPLVLLKQNVHGIILNILKLNKTPVTDLPRWRELVTRFDATTEKVDIAIVGKYTAFTDAYLSVIKGLFYAGMHANRSVNIVWVNSEDLEPIKKTSNSAAHEKAWEQLKSCQGILVPGGFGDRGIEGMITAINYARVNKVPYLGICLGMQLSVIEYCRNVLKIADATSSEFNTQADHPVITYMPDVDSIRLGGTMRLGRRDVKVTPGSLTHYLYGQLQIVERHRHRYEVNPEYIDKIIANKGTFTGVDVELLRMEVFELHQDDHPYFIACQYHPEFLSRPLKPSPPFLGLVLAASNQFDRTNRAAAFPEMKTQFEWYNTEASAQPL